MTGMVKIEHSRPLKEKSEKFPEPAINRAE
jgi:hypothetical protein